MGKMLTLLIDEEGIALMKAIPSVAHAFLVSAADAGEKCRQEQRTARFGHQITINGQNVGTVGAHVVSFDNDRYEAVLLKIADSGNSETPVSATMYPRMKNG